MPTARTTATELTAALETKLLERLAAEWVSINETYFQGVLRRPVFRLSDTRVRLGQWSSALRSLEVSRTLVVEQPWAEVVEVLKHETAHQFVDERLAVDESPHGPAFRSVCARLGIEGGPTASLGQASSSDTRIDRMVVRIRKLLALAQSPNQHEAEAAATTARKLMLKFNLEVDPDLGPDLGADLGPDLGPASGETSGRSRYGFRHLGRPSGRILEHDRRLAQILTSYFFVEGLWIPVYRPLEGKRGSVLEIVGLEANLIMAEHVHAFLSATALRLWSEYRKAHGSGSNRDRQAFLAGVMLGFDAKLEAQSATFAEQGLVWVPGAELTDYFRRRYPRTQTVRRGGAPRSRAYEQGQQAGGKIVLSQPVSSENVRAQPRALEG